MSLREQLEASVWRETILGAYAGKCAVTGAKADDIHHILPAQSLRRRGLHQHLWDVRNGLPVSRRVHERHTTAVERIRRVVLPQAAEEFAAELGLGYLLDRYYGPRVTVDSVACNGKCRKHAPDGECPLHGVGGRA